MPVNYAREYLMFVQTGVVFLPFHVRVKNGRHYSNFEKKNLKFEIYIIFYIYFQKMTVFLWFPGTGFALISTMMYKRIAVHFGFPNCQITTSFIDAPYLVHDTLRQ